jgi:hypothetical protein
VHRWKTVRLLGNSEEVLVQLAVTVHVLERHRGILSGRQVFEMNDETLPTGCEYLARPLLSGGREGFGPVVDRHIDLASAGGDSRDLDCQITCEGGRGRDDGQ